QELLPRLFDLRIHTVVNVAREAARSSLSSAEKEMACARSGRMSGAPDWSRPEPRSSLPRHERMDRLAASTLALAVSAVTAWLTLFRRGDLQMMQPTVVFFDAGGGSRGDALRDLRRRRARER